LDLQLIRCIDFPSEEKMTESTDTLYERALELFANVPDDFLELGRALTQLHDRDAGLFRQLATKSNIGRRKAYHLVEVSQTFEPLAIPRDQLRKIGWPKLQLIAKHVTADTSDALLQLAEDNTAKDLERHTRGKKPPGNAHCVLMYFSPKPYAELEKARLKNGGERAGGGVIGEEEALINTLRQAAPGLDNVQPKGKLAHEPLEGSE
jgi:hypothetical protein